MQQVYDGLNAKQRRIFTCANGVMLALRPVPSLAIVAITRQLKEPKPPIIIDEERGNREYENPSDPSYIRAIEDYRNALGDATTTAYLANGVTVQEPLPDGIIPMDSAEWSEGLELIGLTIPTSGIARRVAWLKYHIVGDSDLADLITAIATAGGLVSEEDVAAVAETFRNNTTGHADIESNDKTED